MLDEKVVTGPETNPPWREIAAPQRPRAVFQNAADIEARPIRWLWPDRIAMGKPTLIAGDPGLGKSQLTCAIAAAVTIGAEWPAGEGHAPRGSVIMVSAEDDPADTIKPRLEAAGADCRRVSIFDRITDEESGEPAAFGPSELVRELRAKAAEIGDVRLMIIDPIGAYFGAGNSYRDTDARAFMQLFADLAAEIGAAFVMVAHPNKNQSASAIHRVTGSGGFVAAARAAYLVARDPEDEQQRLLLPIKNNLGEDRLGLRFKIEERATSAGLRPAVLFGDEHVTITADEALKGTDGESRSSREEEAQTFLLGVLRVGAKRANDVIAQSKEQGIATRTLNRAKATLGIRVAKRRDANGSCPWWWSLPEEEDHG